TGRRLSATAALRRRAAHTGRRSGARVARELRGVSPLSRRAHAHLPARPAEGGAAGARATLRRARDRRAARIDPPFARRSRTVARVPQDRRARLAQRDRRRRPEPLPARGRRPRAGERAARRRLADRLLVPRPRTDARRDAPRRRPRATAALHRQLLAGARALAARQPSRGRGAVARDARGGRGTRRARSVLAPLRGGRTGVAGGGAWRARRGIETDARGPPRHGRAA